MPPHNFQIVDEDLVAAHEVHGPIDSFLKQFLDFEDCLGGFFTRSKLVKFLGEKGGTINNLNVTGLAGNAKAMSDYGVVEGECCTLPNTMACNY